MQAANNKTQGEGKGLDAAEIKRLWDLGEIAREKLKKGMSLTPDEARAYAFREKGRANASRKNGGEGGRPEKDYSPTAKAFLAKSGKRILYRGGAFYVFDKSRPALGYRKTDFAEMMEDVGRWLVNGGGAESGWAEKNVVIALRALCKTDFRPPCRLDTGEALGAVAFMANGLLDIDKAAEGKPDALTPYDKIDPANFFSTEAYSFPWEPDCPAPYWERFKLTAFPNSNTRLDVLRMFGVAIGNRQFTAFWHFNGEPGAGRSRLFAILERMLGGPPRTTSLPPDCFGDKHRIGELSGGTVANLVPDGCRWGGPREQEMLKTITGGGGVKIANRPLYVNAQQAEVTVRVMAFASNGPLPDLDAALQDRQNVIPMNVRFRGTRAEIPDLEKIIAPDRNSPDYPGELPAVFADAVRGWAMVKDLPGIPKCAEGQAHVDAQARALRPVECFLAECGARPKMGARAMKRPMLAAFDAWLAENGLTWEEDAKPDLRQARFTRAVTDRFPSVLNVKVWVYPKGLPKRQEAAFSNLEWTPPAPSDADAPPPDDAEPLASKAEVRPDDFAGIGDTPPGLDNAPPPEDAPPPVADDWKPATP